jgi:cell division protein FtsN
MTHDYAKPSTTKKPGEPKKKKSSSAKVSSSKASASKKSGGASLKEAPPLPARKSRAPLFISLFALICAFAYGIYFLQSIPPTATPKKEDVIAKQAPKTQQPKEAEEETSARFNFYDILPKSTVTAPKVEEYRFKQKTGDGTYSYIVQTGSFKNRADAERQKATIAFQGLKADIETVTSDSGTVWHRVKTGPFNDRSKLNSALDKLVSINIQPLVKKIKKDS